MRAPPDPNPVISLQMRLETFNTVQRVLAKQKFSKIADILLGLRQQVQVQCERIQQQQQEEERAVPRMPPSIVRQAEDGA